MHDFIVAALPWLVLGITLAIVMANYGIEKKDVYQLSEKIDGSFNEEVDKKYGGKSYFYLELFCGIALGVSFINAFGINALSYGVCFGMLIGNRQIFFYTKIIIN